MPARPAPSALNHGELASHREALLRFARRRVYDPALAEDAVHDVFEAVLNGRATFSGRSALRTWLVGILKNKIVDLVRQRAGDESLSEDGSAEHDAAFCCSQPRPDEVAEQRELLSRTLQRIDALPHTLRDAIMRRVVHEESTRHVCASLGISQDNLFVRVHRARKLLLS